jgi:large subunit ribosomal protein L18
MNVKAERRKKIQLSIRGKISGTSTKPRLNVFRSNKEIYCQLIDDVNGVTLAAASSKQISEKGPKSSVASAVGKLVAEKGKAAGISTVVFDRGGYLYHGRIKSLADGAREGGLVF